MSEVRGERKEIDERKRGTKKNSGSDIGGGSLGHLEQSGPVTPAVPHKDGPKPLPREEKDLPKQL
jgi:hypothetical protein